MKKIIFVSHCILNTASKVVLYNQTDMDAEENLRKKFMHKQLIRKYRLFNCLVQNLHYMVQNAGDMLAISSTILFFAIIVVKFLLRVFNNSKNIWQMKTGSKCWELLGQTAVQAVVLTTPVALTGMVHLNAVKDWIKLSTNALLRKNQESLCRC